MPFVSKKNAARQEALAQLQGSIPQGETTIQMMVLRTAGEDYVFKRRAQDVLLTGWLAQGNLYCTNRQGRDGQFFAGGGQNTDSVGIALIIRNAEQLTHITEAIAPFDEMGNGLILTLTVNSVQRYWMRERDNGTGFAPSIEVSDFEIVDVRLTDLAQQTYEQDQEGPFADPQSNRLSLQSVFSFFNPNTNAKTGANKSGKRQAVIQSSSANPRPSRN